MTTYYAPYFDQQQECDYDVGFGGEGDNGSFMGGPQLQKSSAVQIIEVNGYEVEISAGQRKVGGPPKDFVGAEPGYDCEIFCGNIPREMFEDKLIPMFTQFGPIWNFRLMMDPMTSKSRGYAFVKFLDSSTAMEAVRQVDKFELRPGKKLTVALCKLNVRLFVGNIPKIKGKEELMAEFARRTDGLVDLIIYNSPDENKRNRGFCFLEYKSHKHACLAKKKLFMTPMQFWGCDIIVDWADPMEEPDEEVMSGVKILYVRNLTQFISQEALGRLFRTYGNIERVKKIKDYAFVHFEEREAAGSALEKLNGKLFCGTNLEITWAKPPTEKAKRETILRARERRTKQLLSQSQYDRNEYRRGMPTYEGNVNYSNNNLGNVGSGSSGQEEFSEWRQHEGQRQNSPDNALFHYCPYLEPKQTFDQEFRTEQNPSSQQRDSADGQQTSWSRRSGNTFGLFGPPGPRGSASNDENWRLNCGSQRSQRNEDAKESEENQSDLNWRSRQ